MCKTSARDTAVFSSADVASHNHEGSAWVVVDSKVYDVTEWLDAHPGGKALLLAFAGRDCTDEFTAMHGGAARLRLPPLCVGRLSDESTALEPRISPKTARATSAFRALQRQLAAAGYFRPQTSAYTFIAARTLAFLAAALVCLLPATSSPAGRLLGAVLLGLFWQQSLLFAHDILHRHVFPNSLRLTKTVGMLFGGALGGIGAHWWNADHSLHHMLTNVIGHDPSAGSEPILYCDAKHYLARPNLIGRLMLSIQVYAYLPLCLLFARPYIHLLSTLTSPTLRTKLLDGGSLLFYFAWVGALFRALPCSPKEALALFAVANVVCSVLHLQLNLNHYPTGMFSKDAFHRMSFVQFQLLTSMNVKSHWLMDWFHGGLQFQIEHHAFPRLPRNHLRAVSPMMRGLAEEHVGAGLIYREEGFIEATVSCLDSLAAARDGVVALEKKTASL